MVSVHNFNRVGNGNYDISSKKHAFWIFKNQEMCLFARTLHFSQSILIIICDAPFMDVFSSGSFLNKLSTENTDRGHLFLLSLWMPYFREHSTYIVFSFANSVNDWLMRTAQSLVLRSPLKKYMYYCTWTKELCVSTWMGDRLGIRSVVDLFNN